MDSTTRNVLIISGVIVIILLIIGGLYLGGVFGTTETEIEIEEIEETVEVTEPATPPATPPAAEPITTIIPEPDFISQLDPSAPVSAVPIPTEPEPVVRPTALKSADYPPCKSMVSDPNYNMVISKPLTTWTDNIRNTSIVIAHNATGIAVSKLQGFSNGELMQTLSTNCAKLRGDPYFLSFDVSHSPWTDDQRNTIIVILNGQTGISIPHLQSMSNTELESLVVGRS